MTTVKPESWCFSKARRVQRWKGREPIYIPEARRPVSQRIPSSRQAQRRMVKARKILDVEFANDTILLANSGGSKGVDAGGGDCRGVWGWNWMKLRQIFGEKHEEAREDYEYRREATRVRWGLPVSGSKDWERNVESYIVERNSKIWAACHYLRSV